MPIGLGGLTTNKFEGDHCTPIGEFKFEKFTTFLIN